MSINVTVSGNPICIKRGKMVTTNYDPSRQEFDKRRLMRLEQVRQQSKNIAESVRNKVQKQKTKQLSDIERDGEIKLKSWQARKLLDLQDQYQEALNEIGIGHKQADAVERDEELNAEQQENNTKLAKERGRVAAERLQVEKNEASLKKAIPVQRKKLSRDIENSRSQVISNLNRSSSDKKKRKRGQSAIERLHDSDSENQVPNLCNISEDNEDESSARISSFRFSELEDPLQFSSTKRNTVTRAVDKEQQTSIKDSKEDKEAQTVIQEPVRLTERSPVRDTRISERIKRRLILTSCDTVAAEKELTPSIVREVCKCCKHVGNHSILCKEKEVQTDELKKDVANFDFSRGFVNVDIPSGDRKTVIDEDLHHPTEEESPRNDLRRSSRAKSVKKALKSKPKSKSPQTRKQTISSKTQDVVIPSIEKTQIPARPKVTLKSAKTAAQSGFTHFGQGKKVQYYDHPNRFAKEYYPKHSYSEKIDGDDLIISPNLSEENIHDTMRRRDLEAHIRGKLASEKERIERDYRDLLYKLPLLQNQERIAEIGLDKEKFHMSRDRLAELERKRQNRLDNAYEELFLRRQPPKVTVTSKYPEKDTPPSGNLSKWDSDFDPSRIETIPTGDDTTSKSRNEQLSDLLKTLKKQKKLLMSEIQETLPPESFAELTRQLSKSSDRAKSASTHDINGIKRKRRDRVVSPSSSEESAADIAKKTSPTTSTSLKDQSSQTKIAPSPRKKAKTKRKTLILQNISTQTTPKTESVATSPIIEKSPEQKITDEACKCKQTDEFCEIVIKIQEDNAPEVIVNPPSLQSNVKVVTQDKDKESKIEDETAKTGEQQIDDDNIALVPDKSSKIAQSSSRGIQKNASWREQFNNTSSTTSTSYLDPPKFIKPATKRIQTKQMLDMSTSSKDGKLDPRLLVYIKKLLEKSHGSIDDLTVSSASSVSTPSQSVIETPSNNPLMQLKNVMKYFNLKPAEVEKHLKAMSDGENTHYNTSISLASSTTTTTNTSDGEKTVRFKSCVDIAKSKDDNHLTNVTSTTEYEDIAISCNKKISDLTAMIEKVREEKKKILETTPPILSEASDLDNTSTSYLNLPPSKSDHDDKESTTGSSTDDLLNIDYGYAEKLKCLTSEQIDTEKKKIDIDKSTDEQLLTHLKDILQGEKTDKPDFAPLLDIPKLPKLQTPAFMKTKPPPSKGLRNLNYNAPVPVIPHELSTIIEADSQLSNKADSPTKTADSDKVIIANEEVPDILSGVSRADSKHSETNSSDDKSEIEAMETMLKSIGMEWAIPTLKKTREALALTSSSSSSSLKKDSSSLTLREFLSKISTSSSGKSLDSPCSLLSESQDISLMQVDMRRTSTPVQGYKNKDNNDSKNAKSSFMTDSDISSVREHSGSSCREKFYDLADKSDNNRDNSRSRESEIKFRDLECSNSLDKG